MSLLIFTASPGVAGEKGKIVSSAAPVALKTLRVRTLGDPLTLDWNRAFTPVEATLVRNLMEGLVSIGPKMTVLPALAVSWHISRDGRTYTFNLRKDVKWTDGQPLRARHFVDSWRRLLSPTFKGSYAYLLFDIEYAQAFHDGKVIDFNSVGVKALNDFTLQVTLRAPIAYWIWIPTFWATFPIRQDLIDRLGAKFDKPGLLVTLGPYVYASYEPHHNVLLTANPDYYGKRGNIDQIVAALVEEENTAIRLYDNKQIDFITRLGVETKRLIGRPDFIRWPEARVMHLNFNPNQGAVADVRLRRAIAMAIDRNKLAKLLEGASGPASSFIPPGILGYSADAGIECDPQRARELYQKTGLGDGAPQELELIVASFNDDILAANFIADELKKTLGIDVKIHKYEPKQFYSPMVMFGGYSMILNRWTADFPDPDNFYSIFTSGSGNNRVGWKNAKYDEAVVAARAIISVKERKAAYTLIHRQLVEDNVIAVPLYYGRNCALVRYGIKGFSPTPTNSYLFKDFSIR